MNLSPVTLSRLLETQGLVRCVVDRLASSPAEQIDQAIDAGLADLGQCLQVDRAYVFMVSSELLRNTHEWCASGIAPEINNLQYVPISAFPFWWKELNDSRPVLIPEVKALPLERSTERDVLTRQGIQSLVAVPMISLGRLVGFVGFDSVRQERIFETGEINCLSTLADGITAAMVGRDARAEVGASQARLAAMTQHVSDFVLLVDDFGKASYLSPSLERLGFDPETWNTDWTSALHPEEAGKIGPLVQDVIDRKRGPILQLPDCRVWSTDGTWHWIEATLSDLREDSAVAGIVINAHDITERKQTEARLAEEALCDALTGLGNRSSLADRLDGACRGIQAEGGSMTVFFLDLDGFKLVNDGLGHQFGDELLIAVASRLRAFAEDSDSLARFGGDEFVYLTDSLASDDEVAARGEKLLECFRKPLSLGEQQFLATASIGAVRITKNDFPISPERIIADADTAMYQAKRQGRNRMVQFDESHRQRAQRFTRIQQRLGKAVQQGKLKVHFQPIVELTTGRLHGVEALLRWTDEELGPVSPAEFVLVAEESGLIADLDRFVLDSTLDQMAALPRDIVVSVNVSAHLMTLKETSEGIVSALDQRGITGTRLCVEVTETAILEHPAAAASTLEILNLHGVKAALDDFGTGASSLAVLRELPVDILKIDRSFVAEATTSASDRSLIRAVIGLADDFGMKVTAEGIETEAQRRLLIGHGCYMGQGYLFSPAVPANEIRSQYPIDDTARQSHT